MKGGRKYEGSKFTKVGSKLEGSLPSHCSCGSRGLLLEGYGGTTTSLTLECEQFEKILLLSETIMLRCPTL